MDKILRALYYGEILPAEQHILQIEENKIQWKKHYQQYEDFINKLGSPLDKEFERIMDEQFDILPQEFSQMFVDGFRLGAKMIIEIYEGKISIES